MSAEVHKVSTKFRKKPIEIEAMRFDGIDSYLDIVEWAKASGKTDADAFAYRTPIMLIPTLEGTMAANPGDWIIRGIQGEFYPCKSDIFADSYELVE